MPGPSPLTPRPPFRVIVTGSRDWDCGELALRVVASLHARHGAGLLIRHGAAKGVDAAFHRACVRNCVATHPFPARWDDLGAPGAVVRTRGDGTRYNANAGPVRDAAIIAAGADLCLGFARDIRASRGTAGCLRLALAAGIPAWLTAAEDGRPVRLGPGDLDFGEDP